MLHRPQLSRRDFVRLSSAGVIAGSMSGWFETLAALGSTYSNAAVVVCSF